MVHGVSALIQNTKVAASSGNTVWLAVVVTTPYMYHTFKHSMPSVLLMLATFGIILIHATPLTHYVRLVHKSTYYVLLLLHVQYTRTCDSTPELNDTTTFAHIVMQ